MSATAMKAKEMEKRYLAYLQLSHDAAHALSLSERHGAALAAQMSPDHQDGVGKAQRPLGDGAKRIERRNAVISRRRHGAVKTNPQKNVCQLVDGRPKP